MGVEFRDIDILGYDINLLHKNSSTYKTKFGSLLTLINVCFVIFATFYFGLDLFYRLKPITRQSNQMINEAEIKISDFPVMLEIRDGRGIKLNNTEKYFSFSGYYYEIGIGEDIKFYEVQWEKCDVNKHFSKYKNSINENILGNLKTNLCLNPNIVYENNQTISKNVSFMNQFGENNSKFLILQVKKCQATSEITCDEMFAGVDKEFYVLFNYINYYIDLKSYSQPNNTIFSTYNQVVSDKLLIRNNIKFKLAEVITDSGIILEEEQSVNFHMFESIKSDFLSPMENENRYYEILLEVGRIKEIHYRKYIKVQDILASMGGIFKFLMLAGQIIIYFYSKYSFYLEISESLLYSNPQKLSVSKEKSEVNVNSNNQLNISVNVAQNIKYLNNLHNFNIQQIKIPIEHSQVKPKKLNLKFSELFKNKLCCNNVRKSDYNKTLMLIYSLLEIRKILHLNLTVNNLLDIITKREEDKRVFNMRINIESITEEQIKDNFDVDEYEKNDLDEENHKTLANVYKKSFIKLIE